MRPRELADPSLFRTIRNAPFDGTSKPRPDTHHQRRPERRQRALRPRLPAYWAAPAAIAPGISSDSGPPTTAHWARPRRSGGCGAAISVVETGQWRCAGTPCSFRYFASASRVGCNMAAPSLVHAASSFFPSRVQPGSGAPKIRTKRAGHSLPACEWGALHSKHISGCRMCGYGECEPRIDVEYGIQSSLRLRAAVA